MRKATREFLKKLKLISKDAMFVNVLHTEFSEARPQNCYTNMMLFLKQNEQFYLRSGWLVGEYMGENGTAIMPHYWVYDGDTNTDYDVTPVLGGQKYEYILDLEISNHVDKKSMIAVPAAMKLTGDSELLIRVAEDKYVKTDTVDYGKLFEVAAQAGE